MEMILFAEQGRRSAFTDRNRLGRLYQQRPLQNGRQNGGGIVDICDWAGQVVGPFEGRPCDINKLSAW